MVMAIWERGREERFFLVLFLVEMNISLNCKFGQFKHFGRFRPATNLLLMDDVLWPPLLATATTYRRTLCSFPPLRNVFDGTCLRLNRLMHKKNKNVTWAYMQISYYKVTDISASGLPMMSNFHSVWLSILCISSSGIIVFVFFSLPKKLILHVFLPSSGIS